MTSGHTPVPEDRVASILRGRIEAQSELRFLGTAMRGEWIDTRREHGPVPDIEPDRCDPLLLADLLRSFGWHEDAPDWRLQVANYCGPEDARTVPMETMRQHGPESPRMTLRLADDVMRSAGGPGMVWTDYHALSRWVSERCSY